ncbi:MAG: DUF1616 domain-containing protein [Chloroflexi bacterium]|nr:DUF1616 domain-containing protein [Chloroflexota bacterium]
MFYRQVYFILQDWAFSLETASRAFPGPVSPGGRNIWNKILTIILAAVILGTLGTIIYVVKVPRPESGFSEFYLLGLDGKASGYPTELRAGETGKVIAGIVNREQRPVVYRMEVRVDGVLNGGSDGIALEQGKEWQEEVEFTLDRAGEGQKVEFLLYRQEDSQPYRQLHLWVTGR